MRTTAVGSDRRSNAMCSPGSRRDGVVTVMALAVLAILAALIVQQVHRVLVEHRQTRQELIHLQTEKLSQAGLEMGVAAWREDPSWEGLTWNLPAGTIHKTNTAEVVIRIQDATCTAVARYPANSEIPIRVTRTRKLTP